MLKGIDPIIGPELLSVLRSMGHGDEIAIVDGNYPADEHGRRVVRADGHALIPVLNAVLTIMPIDEDVEFGVFRATNRDSSGIREQVHTDIETCCKKHIGDMPVMPMAGRAFYSRVKGAYAVIATSEPRLFANVILRKGVIRPNSR